MITSLNDKMLEFDIVASILLTIPALMTPGRVLHSLCSILTNGGINENIFLNFICKKQFSFFSIGEILVFIMSCAYLCLCYKMLTYEMNKSMARESRSDKSMHKDISFLSMNYLIWFKRIYLGKENILYITDKKRVRGFMTVVGFIIGVWLIGCLLECVIGSESTYIPYEVKIIAVSAYGVFSCYLINKKYLMLLFEKYNMENSQ